MKDQVVTPRVEEFLFKQHALFCKIESWKREVILRHCRHHQAGWEYYESFNGCAAAATFWYLEQGLTDPSPKKVMHEIRKHLNGSK